LEFVARIAGAVAERIAALDHELGDDPVKDRAVVERFGDPLPRLGILPGPLAAGEPHEVGDRLGRLLLVELAGEGAHGGLELRVERALARKSLECFLELELAARRIRRLHAEQGKREQNQNRPWSFHARESTTPPYALPAQARHDASGRRRS